ncbi:MAG: hypothetical protein WBD45_07180 [Terriglobales bacterium]
MTTKKQPAMSDLERINRSYVTGSQYYTPTVNDDAPAVKRPEDQKNSKDALKSQLPSQA